MSDKKKGGAKDGFFIEGKRAVAPQESVMAPVLPEYAVEAAERERKSLERFKNVLSMSRKTPTLLYGGKNFSIPDTLEDKKCTILSDGQERSMHRHSPAPLEYIHSTNISAGEVSKTVYDVLISYSFRIQHADIPTGVLALEAAYEDIDFVRSWMRDKTLYFLTGCTVYDDKGLPHAVALHKDKRILSWRLVPFHTPWSQIQSRPGGALALIYKGYEKG